MNERVSDEPVWVLHRRAWRETSLQLELLSRHHGRIALLARGCRRPERTALRPEPFHPFLAGWRLRQASGLGTLSGLESDGPAVRLVGEGLWAGFYLNEVLLRILPRGVPQEGVHDLYGQTLEALGVGPVRAEALRVHVRRFEKRLLEALGFGPDLRHATPRGSPLDPERVYRPRIDANGILVLEPAEGGVRGALLLALAEERFAEPGVLALADRILPACLAVHASGLGRSRSIYGALRRLVPSFAASPPSPVTESFDAS